ncbi:hypothetical protein [Pseudodesulfovibrio tunisiensis]|nr:hypothetical protein [Pseudodesulfovibrio tunisiensis]
MNGTSNETNTRFFEHKKGVTYFSKRTERIICFLLTLCMLCWGVVESLIQ